MAIIGADGTVTPVYSKQLGDAIPNTWNTGQSGLSGDEEAAPSSIATAQNETTYFGADHLGSTRMEFAGGGWPTWSEDYAPYGQEVTPQTTHNHYKFTGYERDPETAIAAGTEEDYAQARYYSSAIQGRFMSPDPYAGSMHLTNPQSLNRYTYAMNNPVRFSDPSGLECVWDDGSYDEAGDPQTGTDAGCEGQGGTYIDPGDFEGLEGNEPGSWAAPGDPSNSTIAFDFLTISSTVVGSPNDVPMSGPLDIFSFSNMTQEQVISMFEQAGFLNSPADTLLSKITRSHRGTNMRQNTPVCSIHLNIDPGSGQNGTPVTGHFHYDLFSPLAPGTAMPEFPFVLMHLNTDVIPDIVDSWVHSTVTGNNLCQ